MSADIKRREPLNVLVPGLGNVRLTGDRADVYEAFLACLRRQADCTFSEMFEMLQAQLGRPLQVHAYSGRPSELVALGVLERAPSREDAQVVKNRAAGRKASLVYALRLPVVQREVVF